MSSLYYIKFRGLLAWDGILGSAAFWQTSVGAALAIKLAAVTSMLILSAMHDFWIGPAAGRVEAGTPVALALRRRAALLARVNALAGVVGVIAAVWLVRG